MRKTLALAALAVLVIIGAGVYLGRDGIHAGLEALKLVPEPEPFTELYFNDFTKLSGTLPHTIEAGDSISFSFTINNKTGKTMEYPYVVALAGDSGTTTVVSADTVTLAADTSVTIPATYTFKKAQERASVTVTLTDLQQSIHFFVPAMH